MARRDPYTKDPFDVVELLARLAGRCAMRVPGVQGRGEPLTDADLATALGLMPDQFAADVVLAVATRDHGKTRKLTDIAYHPMLNLLARAPVPDIDTEDPVVRHQCRLVLHLAVIDLIYPEKRVPVNLAARAVRLRRITFQSLYRRAAALLSAALDDARADLKKALYAQS